MHDIMKSNEGGQVGALVYKARYLHIVICIKLPQSMDLATNHKQADTLLLLPD